MCMFDMGLTIKNTMSFTVGLNPTNMFMSKIRSKTRQAGILDVRTINSIVSFV